MSYNPSNIFARILRGEIPCKKIYENEFVFSFYDISPKAPIHALVIPKGSYIDAQDFHLHASSNEIAGFYKGLAEVVKLLNIHEDGFRQISNCGVNGGQEVPHYHVHILAGKSLGPMVSKNDN